MKRHLLTLIGLACALFATGCEPKIITEPWHNYVTDISIDLHDGEGWSWFDAHRPDGNMRKNNVTIAYGGEVYGMVYLDPNTRADEPIKPILPLWDENGRPPFRLSGYFGTESSPVRLLFGEFSVDTEEYRGETFTIDWGDGTRSVVKFDLYVVSDGKGAGATIHTAIWVESGLGQGSRSDNSLTLSIEKD